VVRLKADTTGVRIPGVRLKADTTGVRLPGSA